MKEKEIEEETEKGYDLEPNLDDHLETKLQLLMYPISY